jgi:hypothetical protein
VLTLRQIQQAGQLFSHHVAWWLVGSALLVIALAVRQIHDTSDVPAPAAAVDEVSQYTRKTAGPAEWYAWLSAEAVRRYEPLVRRFPAPEGYVRVAVSPGDYGDWLRHLPLRPDDAPVDRLAAVVDWRWTNARRLGAANAVLRLRGEYLWFCCANEAIAFRFTSGDLFEWKRWADGWAPAVAGRRVEWRQGPEPGFSRQSYTKYLDTLLAYASVNSLAADTHPVTDGTIQPGDVLVESGRGGFAAVVLDVAVNADGRVSILIGQTVKAAGGFCVIQAAADSVWHEAEADAAIDLPGWGGMRFNRLRRW